MRQYQRTLSIAAGIALVSVLAACGGGSGGGSGSSDADVESAVSSLPDYYPSDYKNIVDASTKEDGVDLYGVVGPETWDPIVKEFQRTYPWIKVRTLDLGHSEVFERYKGESASGSSAADLLQSTASGDWWNLATGDDAVEKYQSPESPKLPKEMNPLPGVFTQSSEPMLIIYNKKALDEDDWPTSMQDLVDLVNDNPGKYDGKLSTYGFNEAYAIYKTLFDADPANFEKVVGVLGPNTRLETSSGPILEKVTSGEYVTAYFQSAAALAQPVFQGAGADLLGTVIPSDGTTSTARNIGIPKGSDAPNSAKLLIDFLLSEKGQTMIQDAYLVPVRDVKVRKGWYSYKSVQELVEGEVAIGQPSEELASTEAFDEFEAIFNRLFKG